MQRIDPVGGLPPWEHNSFRGVPLENEPASDPPRMLGPIVEDHVDSKFSHKLRELEHRILDQPGTLDPLIRRAAANGEAPAELAGYVEKVRLHAYRVTDADVEALRALGYLEDQIFELTVAAAYGAARHRLDTALQAMAGRSLNLPTSTEGTAV